MYFLMNIARGISLNLLFLFLLVAFMISTGFQLSLTGFSISIIIIITIIGFYVGIKSTRFGLFNGLLVGLATCAIFLLYISQVETMDQTSNMYLIGIFSIVSAIAAFVGSMFNRSGKKKKKENLKTDRRRKK